MQYRLSSIAHPMAYFILSCLVDPEENTNRWYWIVPAYRAGPYRLPA